jgi:hypothetical protein
VRLRLRPSIGDDHIVAQLDDAMGVLRDSQIAGHEDDRVPLTVQLLQYPERGQIGEQVASRNDVRAWISRGTRSRLSHSVSARRKILRKRAASMY